PERMEPPPRRLSVGQQQRVAIARARINNPPVLLAGEPSGNLGSLTSREILEMIQRLNADGGLTVLIVTHDPGVAATAQREIRLKDGLVESGAHAEGMTNAPPMPHQ